MRTISIGILLFSSLSRLQAQDEVFGIEDPAAVIEDDAPAQDDEAARPPEEQKSIADEVTQGVRIEDIVEPPTEYRYAAFGRKDPFVPEPAEEIAKEDEIPIVSPLQRYPINQLRLVGIWRLDSGDRKALILTPKDEGIIVKAGDPIGNKRGRILELRMETLLIREFIIAPDGTRQYEDVEMNMNEENQVARVGIQGQEGVELPRQPAPGVPVNQAPGIGGAAAPGAAGFGLAPGVAAGVPAVPGVPAAAPGLPDGAVAPGAQPGAVLFQQPIQPAPPAEAQAGNAGQKDNVQKVQDQIK